MRGQIYFYYQNRPNLFRLNLNRIQYLTFRQTLSQYLKDLMIDGKEFRGLIIGSFKNHPVNP